MDGDRLSGRDYALSLAILLSLALPLVPVPHDSGARMQVRFHSPGMEQPRDFSAKTTQRVCSIMAITLAYDDPKTGNFTRISCED
jgi:hypothetical protein